MIVNFGALNGEQQAEVIANLRLRIRQLEDQAESSETELKAQADRLSKLERRLADGSEK